MAIPVSRATAPAPVLLEAVAAVALVAVVPVAVVPAPVADPVDEPVLLPVEVWSEARALNSDGNSVEQMGRTDARDRIWGQLVPAFSMELSWAETQELSFEL
jgi:hypothetical protein